MNEYINQKLKEQDQKLDAVFNSVEKIRKYFLIIIWVTIIAVVLPAIGLVFVIPQFLSLYTGLL